MTADELAAIEARANAATPGPWETRSRDIHERYLIVKPVGVVDAAEEPVVSVVAFTYDEWIPPYDPAGGPAYDAAWERTLPPERNLAFIAHARQDVPRLVARVRELEAERARLRAVADEAREVAMHVRGAGVRGYDEDFDRAHEALEDALHDLDHAHPGPAAPERDAP